MAENTPGSAHRAAVLAEHGDDLTLTQRTALDRLAVQLDTAARLDAAIAQHGEVNAYGRLNALVAERRQAESLIARYLAMTDVAEPGESQRSAAARHAVEQRWKRSP